MVKIEWNEGLSVADELIDEQHKQLLEKLNDISTSIEKGEGIEIVNRTLDFMIDYTNFHFNTEEKRMIKEKYHRLEYHKGQHQEFVNTLNNLSDDFLEDGATDDLAESVNIFLFNWLIKHIQGVDGALGRYLKEKIERLPN
jgi:hemerythrin